MAIELPRLVASNIDHFTGRAWLLPTLLDWYEHGDERMFLLTGGPGTGKSMIVAWLAGHGPTPEVVEARAQLEQLRKQVAAVHFCMAASRNLSPQAFATNIVNQLTRNITGFGDALAAMLTERVQINVTQNADTVESGSTVTGVSIGRLDLNALGDEQSFDCAISQPLKRLYEDGHDQPMLLLIDALDEAETYTGVRLPQLLAQLDDLPRQVRFLATTRPDPRVLKYFQSAKLFKLSSQGIAHSDDIHAFVLHRLAVANVALDHKQQEFLADRISQAAQGVFLYAHMVLDDVLPRWSNLPDLETFPLPDGLSRLYHEFLNRELGRDEERWYSTFRSMLGLIAVSRGHGLTRSQLRAIASIEIDQALRICKQYLIGDLPEGPFRSFHKSFADFLLDDGDNVDYHIDRAEMHRRIMNYYVSTYSSDWSKCDSYGLSHVIDHAVAAKLSTPDSQTAFERILTDDFVNTIEDRVGWLYSFVEDLGALIDVEPGLAARLCVSLILDRPSNSLVIQHALRLLVKIHPQLEELETSGAAPAEGVKQVVRILADLTADAPARLLAQLERETNPRVRGVIALALAEAGVQEAAPRLVEMLRQEGGEASWPAADALIALNNRTVIPDLVQWYQNMHEKNESRAKANKHRLLYILGRMHAEEAQVIKQAALDSTAAKLVGRGIDLMWLLRPVAEDQRFLWEQLQQVLDSSPDHPETLGLWADEWLQKRIVRAIQYLHLVSFLPDLKTLQTHVRARPSPLLAGQGNLPLEKTGPKRERLIEAVQEAIEELERR